MCSSFFIVELQPSRETVEVCPGTAVRVNCTTRTNDLYWRATTDCGLSYDKGDTALVGVVVPFCDLEAILTSTSPSLMSTVTLSNVSLAHNGTVLTCVNTIVQVNLRADQMASISIVARGNVHLQCKRTYISLGDTSKLFLKVCVIMTLIFGPPPFASWRILEGTHQLYLNPAFQDK